MPAAETTSAGENGVGLRLQNVRRVFGERVVIENMTMEVASFAEAQKPLIETVTLGKMTNERWDTLAAQLKEPGDIPQAPPAAECFRDL